MVDNHDHSPLNYSKCLTYQILIKAKNKKNYKNFALQVACKYPDGNIEKLWKVFRATSE